MRSRSLSRGIYRLSWIAVAVAPALACGFQIPSVAPAPPENPITEQKRVLGKILFWDEQLSTDNTVACGTCHAMHRGGTDDRRTRSPGFDGVFFTADDVFGSPGVAKTDSNGDYVSHPAFVLSPQVTNRAAPPVVNAGLANNGLFHDGRAFREFVDPVVPTTVLIAAPSDPSLPGGALESQAVGPPMNDGEMAHIGTDWLTLCAKLEAVKPLRFATNLPPDVDAVIDSNTTYGDLFAAAFGDGEVTPARIAFAIATYERTLVSNQSPWDAWNADPVNNPLPADQELGRQFFEAIGCTVCHVPPLFTDNNYNNIGIRPSFEDEGRFVVTHDDGTQPPNFQNDHGAFKSVNLRNVGLKTNYMHNGKLSSLLATIQFYKNAGQQFTGPDQNALMPLIVANFNDTQIVPADADVKIEQFLRFALVDSRVAAEQFPFDTPTLWSLRTADRPTYLAGGVTGTDFYTPTMIANTPPMIGNAGFKFGVARGLVGALARLGISASPPVGGIINPSSYIGQTTLAGSGPGGGYGTVHWAVPNNGALAGQVRYFQWFITDPEAPGGYAISAPVRVTFFCSQTVGCPATCPADISDANGGPIADGGIDINDLLFFLAKFEQGDLAADLDDDGANPGLPDGGVDISDLLFFLGHFESGC